MYRVKLIVQDGGLGYQSRIADGIRDVAAAHGDFNSVRVAMAYASDAGCRNLCQELTGAMPGWRRAQKQWLLSIDYGRTEPEALLLLRDLQNSEVKIANYGAVLDRRLMPLRCFHPKTYIFESKKSAALGLFLGSANLTLSGLHTGSEHATSQVWLPEFTPEESAAISHVKQGLLWWEEAWQEASGADDRVIEQYTDLRTKILPEDDTESVRPFLSRGPCEIEVRPGVAWASARCLWVETYELYKNRGRRQPGNQLDLKRGTRVFFGFPADVVAKNHRFGNVYLQCDGHQKVARSLRFGTNSMDKINLPLPGQDGPAGYDNRVVLFERKGGWHFRVAVGTADEERLWRDRSEKLSLVFEMSGGRKFGFF